MKINTVRRIGMKPIKAPTQTQQIKTWFEMVHPDPSIKDVHVQAADHLTSSLAFLLSCQEVGKTSSFREELSFGVNVIDFIQRRIRASSEGIELAIEEFDRPATLLALCSQIRSCIGLAHMLEMDIEGALSEMVVSDSSRLGEDGQPIFNDRNKLVDGSKYRRPDYMQFT